MPFKIGDRVLYRANKFAREYTDRGTIEQPFQGRGPDRYGVLLDSGQRVVAVDEQLTLERG
jgi:hypothetical protein